MKAAHGLGDLVKCLRCGKAWIDSFTDDTAKCPNCGYSGAEVIGR